MRLRPATVADAALLRVWDEEPHVAESGGDPDWNAVDWEAELDRLVSWREMLVAEFEGRPVGFVQIIDAAEEETHYWGDCGPGIRAIDIWIGAETDRRRGHGRAMMRLALARCFADPAAVAVLVDPMADNIGAHRFYEAMGFSSQGRRRFGPDDCLVFRIDRARWREGV